MASLSPQQSRRQSHRTPALDETQHSTQRSTSVPRSTTSVDSSTVYLNDPASSSALPQIDPLQEQASSIRRRPVIQEDEEPRRCWICFSDETDDTPESSAWRSPCPCALTAHEACLLDWIADLESPGLTRATAKTAEIRCPQCKSQIYLARSHSYIVDAFSALESFGGSILLPSVLVGVGYTVLLGASHHGAHSIRMIFGTLDADLILAPSHRWTIVEQTAVRYFPTIATPILRGWRGLRVELGLPLIPAALVASRTSIADAVLPILPIVFFATHPHASKSLSVGYWPPSAALTFVILPYIRSAYDELMDRVWAPHERRWLKEIKPRQGEDSADAAGVQDDADDEDIIHIDIGIEVLDDDEGDFAPPAELGIAPPLDAPPTDAVDAQQRAAEQGAEFDAAFGAQPQANAQPVPPQPHPQPAPGPARVGGTEIWVIAQRAGTSVLGALLFPSAAAASGELLRLLLPLSLTASRRGPKGVLQPTGLLQTRWGRSVVGGCLFVVLKDAIRIYCRWRMATSFRDRRVRDWDKKRGRLAN